MGGGAFVKRGSYPLQNETKLNETMLFLILHFTYLGGGYAPNAPPPLHTGMHLTCDLLLLKE